MGNELQHYTITLHTEGPVFIGSGRTIGKKEYIYNKHTNKVHIPNIEKMFAYFSKRKLLPKYEEYLLSGKSDFVYWLQDNGIDEREYRTWIAYTIDSGDAVIEQKSKKEILTSIKDSYGCPYIPGSSLKGALRTALLGAVAVQRNERFAHEREQLRHTNMNDKPIYVARNLQNTAMQVEQRMFNRLKRNEERNEKRKADAVNDMMCGLRIGDSEPLSADDLTLCQKIDVTVEGHERALPIFRECIKPDTEIRFPITIDPRYFPYSPKQVMQAATIFAQNYDKCFLNAFPLNGISGGGNLYLGGGCGYVSKTVSYPLLGNDSVKLVSDIINSTLNREAKNKYKHRDDKNKGVSPHMLKCTRYDGRLYEMGACTLSIQ